METIQLSGRVYMNMNFALSYLDKKIPAKSVRGIGQEAEQEYIQEGGVNDYVHMRPKPVSKPGTLTVERYIIHEMKELFKINEVLAQDLILTAGESPGGPGEIEFRFKGCVITGRVFGDLDAEKGGILTETLTINYQEMQVEFK